MKAKLETFEFLGQYHSNLFFLSAGIGAGKIELEVWANINITLSPIMIMETFPIFAELPLP